MSKRASWVEHLNRMARANPRYNPLPDVDFHAYRQRPFVKRGPSRWLQMKGRPEFYGKHFDFHLRDKDVFMPCSPVAQHWLWYEVGEDQHWYGDLDGKYWGCVVDDGVLDAAQRDGLRSEADALSENDNQAVQMENQQ